MDKINELERLIKNAKNIVFFGGAGVSTESGIRDFRSKDGLYALKSKYNAPYEVMLSHSYFVNDTKTFFEFYKEFMINEDAKPNSAHLFLAKLEKKKNLTIITQNIDGLHQAAGSQNVIELHGSIHRNYCQSCMRQYDLKTIKNSKGIPHCPICGGIIKPDVVLYEEPLDSLTQTKAMIKLSEADLLIIGGTSLSVYPANYLVNYFFGDNIVIINKEDLPISRKVALTINDSIGSVFSKISI